MKPRKEILKKLIESFNTEPERWIFSEHTADYKGSNIRLWTANIPIINLKVYEPIIIRFSIIDRYRLYKALNQCKSASLLKSINDVGREFNKIVNYPRKPLMCGHCDKTILIINE